MRFFAVVVFLLLVLTGGLSLAQGPQGGASARTDRVMDLKGEQTTLKTAADRSFTAYIVGPKEATRGILVITGGSLNEQSRRWTDQFAALGYRVVTVDLFDGRGDAANPKPAPQQSIDQNDANAKFRAALEALREPGRKLGAVGWCFGAGQALEASLAAPDLVSATVMYFGASAVDAKRLAYLQSPVLLVVRRGEGTNAERIKAFEAEMRRAGKAVEIKKAEGSCDAAPKISEGSTMWEVTQDFLNRYLK